LIDCLLTSASKHMAGESHDRINPSTHFNERNLPIHYLTSSLPSFVRSLAVQELRKSINISRSYRHELCVKCLLFSHCIACSKSNGRRLTGVVRQMLQHYELLNSYFTIFTA